MRVRSAAQSSDPVPLGNLVVTDLLTNDLTFNSWTFDDQATGLDCVSLGIGSRRDNQHGDARKQMSEHWYPLPEEREA